MKMEKDACTFSLVFSWVNYLQFDTLTYNISQIALSQDFTNMLAWALIAFFASTLVTFSFLYLRARKELKVVQAKSAIPKPKVKLIQKKICPKCRTENDLKARFCRSCGFSLTTRRGIVCSSCGEGNLPAARFCRKCGKPLK